MIAASLDSVIRFHRGWALVVIVANGAVGLWGVAAEWIRSLRGRPFWFAVIAAEATIAVQIVLGAYLYSEDLRPGNLHVFYGALLVVAPTLAWIYRSEPAVKRRIYLFYGAASLFFMGLAIRAYVNA